ncbi:platelet binding protein GspB-like isoform X2 [Dermacentor albipictus]
MDLKAKSFLPPCASEPEIYLKSGQFADQGWLHGDDSGLDEAYLDARRTHEIIERRIGVLTPPSFSSPDGFLPHLDSTRLLLSRPGKARRSAGNGAVAGGATTATTTYQWSNGGTAGAGPYQQHRVTTTTTTTTHRSTTTVEETSVRDQVHLLRLPAPPRDEKDLVEREGKPEEEEEESERQQQALDGQSEDRVHEEHTVGEADGPELSDAPPPASSVRRRPSVASSSPAAPVTGADAKDLAAQEVDDARSKDQSDNDVDDASAQRDQQREPSEATPSPAASVRDRRSRSDGAGTITLTLPSPTSGAPARTSLGPQRRPSLTESRRRSVATVPVVESSRLTVPTFQQQPRKLSFAGGSFGPRRGDEDSGGQRLKTRAQSEEALSQDFEGESERRPRRRPSREAESRRSSTAVSADREEQEADTKPEADAEAKAEVDAAEAARDRGSSSAEGTSSDQEPRAGDRVEASRSREEVTKAASEAERDREEEEEAKVEDGYGGREEAEPVGESRDYFREEGPYRLEVTEEEENEESAVAQATSDAPVGKVGDVIAAPSSQRTWKATGGGDRASRRSKYPSSVGQPQLQKQQQKQQQQQYTRAPAATRGGPSRKPAVAGGAKAASQTAMSVPEKVAGVRSRKQSRGQSSGVTVQVAKVRLVPGRPAAEAGTADAEAEVSEIREYVRRGGDRIRDDGGERDASRRASRKAVNNVDTARTVVESYRKSDAAAAAAAKKPKRERTFDVEVYVTELGEAGTQTGGGAGASGKAVKERGSSSKGGGGGSGVRRRSRSHKSLSKSDTRGSLLGDSGHVRADKGADTTDADASSLADSAGFSQDNPSLEDNGGAERERSDIELDRLENKRDIDDAGNGIDGNISADDEGSVDENGVERAFDPSEVSDRDLDSHVDGDEIKPSVAELLSSANAPELREKIESAERNELGSDAVQPVTPEDAGRIKSSEESAAGGEAGDDMLGRNAAHKPEVAEEHEHGVEPNEVEQLTGTPDQKQAEGDEGQRSVPAAPDKFDKTEGHVNTTDTNPEDIDLRPVAEPGDLRDIHDELGRPEESDNQKDTAPSSNDTEGTKELEGDDSHKSIHKVQEIETNETNDDKSAVTNDEVKTLVGDQNNAKEFEASREARGRILEEGSKGLDGNSNDDASHAEASEAMVVDKKPEEPQDVLDNAHSHVENQDGDVTKVDDAAEGRLELDTERNVSAVGTRPGTAVAAETTYSQGDKSHNELSADDASRPTGEHAYVEDGENRASTPEAKYEYGNAMKGVSIEEVNNENSDAAVESEEAAREANDITNAATDTVADTLDIDEKARAEEADQEIEENVNGLPEADQNEQNEESVLNAVPSEYVTISNENNENAKASEVSASEVEASPDAVNDEEANYSITHEGTTIEPTAFSENNKKTNHVENYASGPAAETSPPLGDVNDGKYEDTHTETKADPMPNEKSLENDEADNSDKTQDGNLSTTTKEKDEKESSTEPDAAEPDVVPRDEVQMTNTSADIRSRDPAHNDNKNEKLNEEDMTPSTRGGTSEEGVSRDNAQEDVAREPIHDGNEGQTDGASDTPNNHEATASETLHPAGTTQEALATQHEAEEQEKHNRRSEDAASPDSATIVEPEEGNAEPILAAGKEKCNEEGQGDTHLEGESVDNEDHSDSLRQHPLVEGQEIERTEVPEQEQQVSQTEAEAPNMVGEKAEDADTRESVDNVEANVDQETAAETARTSGDTEGAGISEANAELGETAKATDSDASTERAEKSDADDVQEVPANAKELRHSTSDTNEPDANAEDAVKSADPKLHAEETETDVPTATTDRASPTTDADTSRTEEDSAFADGTYTSTPSPATSRAELASPKDLLREGENLDEGILADEPPATRGSPQDREENGEGDGAVDAATSSSSGRGSRGTVTEVPLPVTHTPQIRGPKPKASRNAEAAKAPKIRAPKGVSVLPSRFKPPTTTKRNAKEHPVIAGTGGVRRIRSDGEHIHQASVAASRTALTTPEQHPDNASRLLGRHSRSVNMEEQGLVEIARLQKKLDTLREERLACEAKREDLLRRAKFLQSKATSTRDQARDMWRRRYAEEKKITPKLEEESARWRLELERLHRELLARVEGELRLTGYPRFEQPSNKLSYKIMIAKVLQEIEDLKRRLEYTRISLGAEVRLRTHAEREVKNLREDLLKKKIQVTLTKKETQSVMAPFLRDSFYFVGPI